MAYVPINPTAYNCALAGAVAGMNVSGFIIFADQSRYTLGILIAGTFAQEFDIAWSSAAPLNVYEIEATLAVCAYEFKDRQTGSLVDSVFTNVANWVQSANACVALIRAGDAFLASMGIVPPTFVIPPAGTGFIHVTAGAVDSTRAVNLGTVDVTGILPTGNGGTGVGSLTAHAIVIGEGTNPLATAGPGAVGVPVIGQGGAADPIFGAINLAGGPTIVVNILPVGNGGTGGAALTAHAVVVGEGTNPLATAGPGNAGQALVGQGGGADPIFGAIALGGGPTVVTGTLPVGNGGTGAAALTAHAVVIGEGTNPLATVGPGAVGVPIIGQGAGADPIFGPVGLSSVTAPSGVGLGHVTNGAWDAAAIATLIPSLVNGQIYIDPANVTGVASDTNPPTITPAGQTVAGLVFLTYRGVSNKWGTTRPCLTANTALVWLSSQPDNTDPVVCEPIMRGTATFSISGAVTAGAGVAIAGLVAKNRTAGANSALRLTIVAPSTTGPTRNTTRANTITWPMRNTGANLWVMGQPFAPSTTTNVTPAENDAWANGDTIVPITYVAVDLVRIAPIIAGNTGVGAGVVPFIDISQINVKNFFTSLTPCVLDGTNGTIQCREVLFQKAVYWIAPEQTTATNCQYVQTFHHIGAIQSIGGGNAVGAAAGPGGTSRIDGTANTPTSEMLLDGDFVCGQRIVVGGGSRLQIGFLFIDDNQILQVNGGSDLLVTAGFYGGQTIYAGAGGEPIFSGLSRLTNAPGMGTFVATYTLPQVVANGFSLNGVRNADSHTAAQPDVLNAGVVTTPANLDAAAGVAGFSGKAMRWAGAVITVDSG